MSNLKEEANDTVEIDSKKVAEWVKRTRKKIQDAIKRNKQE